MKFLDDAAALHRKAERLAIQYETQLIALRVTSPSEVEASTVRSVISLSPECQSALKSSRSGSQRYYPDEGGMSEGSALALALRMGGSIQPKKEESKERDGR